MVELVLVAVFVGLAFARIRSQRQRRELDDSVIVAVCRACGSTTTASDLQVIHAGEMRRAVFNGLFARRHPRRLTSPRKVQCPRCMSRSLVPVDTPAGRKLLDKHRA
jgi:DNA-directed RNA polymerase subunit RPC12/RpoP